MNLRDYLARDRRAAARLAVALGVRVQMIYPWANGRRPCPPLRCLAIERATEGAVTRQDLRPQDWCDIWPELRTRVDAPPLPGAQRAAKLPAQAQAAPAAAAAALEG